jgi:hypothetical protein
MPHPAAAALQSALRARKLDRTLTTALPAVSGGDATALLPTGIESLDRCLLGGLPRGQLSELAGPRSSGRLTVLMRIIASATCRGEVAAFIDPFDRLDVASAAAAGIRLDRLLWVRGAAVAEAPPSPSGLRRPGEGSRSIDRALKALNLVLQAGGFGVVAIDVGDVPMPLLRRLPFTTWLRIQRVVEGSDTACVLVVPEPLARSAGGLTLTLAGRSAWAGASHRSRHLSGIDVRMRIVSPRRRVEGAVEFEAAAARFSEDDAPRHGGHRGDHCSACGGAVVRGSCSG